MLDTTVQRALLLCLVLGAQAGLLVYGGTVQDDFNSPYPNENALARDVEEHVGSEVELSATVVSTDPLVVHESIAGDDLRLTVTGVDVDASVGDRLVVFGVLESADRLRAIEAYTVPSSGLWYAYGTSALAGLWVLVRLVRGWRVDTDRWGLAPREESAGGGDGA